MSPTKAIAAAALLLLCADLAMAITLDGQVVGIADGDTLTLLVDRQQHRIRIAGIDAPEHFQAYGNKSRAGLARYAFRRDARAECYKIDRYGRDVCKVWVRPPECHRCGKTLDAGLAQVRGGLAWWDRYHADEQTGSDRVRYARAETTARQRRLGLWAEARPVPPWVWRRHGAR